MESPLDIGNALITLIVSGVTAVVTLARVRAIGRDRLAETNEELRAIVGVKDEVIAALEQKLALGVGERQGLNDSVTRVRADNEWLRRRYVEQERYTDRLEEMLRAHGVPVPERPRW